MAWDHSSPILAYQTDFREPVVYSDPRHLKDTALEAVAQRGSDLYFQSGMPVLLKVDGVLRALTERRLTTEECLQVLNWAAGNEMASGNIARGEEARSSYSVRDPIKKDARGEDVRYRFRVNAIGGEFRSNLGVQVVMRAIRSEPPNIAELGVDQEIVDAMTPDDGCIYITGATGSGKSTTFAGALRYIMEGDTPIKGNIVTIESPIEYLFETVKSSHSTVFQTEVGRGVKTFGAGIVSMMRHDPSLIVVGETRDTATADAVQEAALTGHPVFTTLHANDCSTIFARMLSFYKPEERDSMLFSIVSTARLLVNQRLVPGKGGGRVPLREYLVMAEALREEIIAESDPRRITSVMKVMLRKHGVSMAIAAQRAYEQGLITEAEMKANSRV